MDLTSLLTVHLESLYDAAAPAGEDYSTLFAANIPTVRADLGSFEQDLNTDYYSYLT
jgi:hypothetical protein